MKAKKPTTAAKPKNKALEDAIAFFDSLSDMARQLGLSGYQVIQQWRKSGRVPSEHCTKLAQITGVSRDALVGWEPMGEIMDSEDDAQPPVGGSSGKEKMAKAVT
ncbi:MAG TPA: hypothetical protein VMT67_11670 [Terriglobales bacterium]|nr:hypothetical protein [Terriglobales bacterium]